MQDHVPGRGLTKGGLGRSGDDCQESYHTRLRGPPSRLAHRDGMKDARRSYLSSQTSSIRQLLIMLLTIIVHPFTCGCQQYANRL
jgi:hypothetical protein